ncbi:Oidioi.mRNA.OKI2018_I69.chr2.g8005.t1.cds [Oikopleura dioica]|uniref:Oidioi.mRNA.OKI2018_I69.chr2.g8005.t1.cds n=1 Tax=Oikopleura dioica TaxID=34765 RepID=A0ABN7TEB8_OIKDI|nr:Oidioi.mRNA.OKI2018_I69.chr2.g8005.t1.cds [Oikopleura dioica]
MSDSESDTEITIANDLVVTKYKMAGEIANRVLALLIEKTKVGVSALEICKYGDDLIVQETDKIYKKEKDMTKGVAFPTQANVNHCICHYAPLSSVQKDVIMKDGDVVKLDLGVHVDGYIAVVAHTVILGDAKKGRAVDALLAAHYCAEAALRLVRPGKENNEVTDVVSKISESYNCRAVEGMLSYQMEKDTIDGKKTIIQNPTEKQRLEHEKCEFAVNEVYAIDMLISTGDGKSRDMDVRTTIYKREPDQVYQLKMKASRAIFSEVEKKFDAMCFNLRALDDEKKAKMGINECVNHGLITPFPVLFEQEKDVVTQFKFTTLLMPNGPLKITGLPFDPSQYESEFKIECEEIKTLLASSVSRKSNKKKKKKAAKKAAADAGVTA